MLKTIRSSSSSVFVWILMGFLVLGLTGFGLTGVVSGLSQQNVAQVGSQKVEREAFFRQLQAQIRETGQRLGTPLSMEQARLFGIDQQVLGRMIAFAALDDETSKLGFSSGDVAVRDQLLETPAFRGINGRFDPESYNLALEQLGMTASEYEEQLRKDLTRGLLQNALRNGYHVPDEMVHTLLGYLQETRDLRIASLTLDDLTTEVEAPTEDAILAAYEASPDAYTAPEIRKVSYAALRPEDLIETVEVSEEDIADLYEALSDTYNTPERRIIDRIVFGSEEEAAAALDRINSGEAGFDKIATERDLSADDIALGGVAADALSQEARALVFAEDETGIFGPVRSALGPALFRVNAILKARSTPLDDVREDLRVQLAAEAAQASVGDWIDTIEDLLAGGATLEELGAETDMITGTAEVSVEIGEGLAADQAFRQEAFEAEIDEERDLIDLSDGGLAVLRVTEIVPPTLRPLEEVRDQIIERLMQEARRTALAEQAEATLAKLQDGFAFTTALGLEGIAVRSENGVLRGADVDGLTLETLGQVFEAQNGETLLAEQDDAVLLIEIADVATFDPTDPANAELIDTVRTNLEIQISADLFQAYAGSIQQQTEVSVNQTLIDQTLDFYQ